MARTHYAADLEGRFWSRVTKTDGCWLWTGTVNQKGYGVTSVNGRHRVVHRLAWTMAGRTLTPGQTLDHLCRVRNCVNPDHLEEVTNRTNVLRGHTLPAANLQKTTCPKGHALDGTKGNGDRYCLTCRREQNRAYRARRGQEVNARKREARALAALAERGAA